jgi:hypothetical protein
VIETAVKQTRGCASLGWIAITPPAADRAQTGASDADSGCIGGLVPSPAGAGLKNQRAAWVSTAVEACLRGRCGLAGFGLSSAPMALARDWSHSYFGLARMHVA